MLFNEIYGSYYKTMAKIISAAIDGSLSDESLRVIVLENAFEESILEIEPSIKSKKWQLIEENYSTSILNKPKMPVTDLQLRWLKTISLDPKIGLFDFSFTGLENIEPLFLPSDIVLFDQYSDGDPYKEDWYKETFRSIRKAIKEKRKLALKYRSKKGTFCQKVFIPICIEYSSRDDKFRLQAIGNFGKATVNIGRICDCKILDEYFDNASIPKITYENVTFILYDERNSLERSMMQFTQYRKEAVKISENQYQICIWYDKEEEQDLMIQLLSFGPLIKILSPEKIISKMEERIRKQKELMKRSL